MHLVPTLKGCCCCDKHMLERILSKGIVDQLYFDLMIELMLTVHGH